MQNALLRASVQVDAPNHHRHHLGTARTDRADHLGAAAVLARPHDQPRPEGPAADDEIPVGHGCARHLAPHRLARCSSHLPGSRQRHSRWEPPRVRLALVAAVRWAVGCGKNGPLRFAFNPKKTEAGRGHSIQVDANTPALVPGTPDEFLHEGESELEAVAKVLEV